MFAGSLGVTSTGHGWEFRVAPKIARKTATGAAHEKTSRDSPGGFDRLARGRWSMDYGLGIAWATGRRQGKLPGQRRPFFDLEAAVRVLWILVTWPRFLVDLVLAAVALANPIPGEWE